MKPDRSPVATTTHAEFYRLLSQQPWQFWAIDSDALKPLVAFQPVAASRLVRMLKSHFTYSDLYLFNPASTEEQIAALDWRQIPWIDAEAIAPYIITHAIGQPFLGIAGSLDAAKRGEIMVLIPADSEVPLPASSTC